MDAGTGVAEEFPVAGQVWPAWVVEVDADKKVKKNN